MTEDQLKKLDDLAAAVAALTKQVGEIAARPQMPDNIIKMETAFTALQADLTATKAAAEASQRNDVIAKMTAEGRDPQNPETGVSYKLDELQKLDLPTLRLLAANSPKLPLSLRTKLAKTEKAAIDPKLTGLAKVEAVYENKYPSRESIPGFSSEPPQP